MLHTGSTTQVTCVTNSFIDNYMKDANGEFVKIYIYLLRNLGREGIDFSISDMADDLNHTEKDILRALAYWAGVGLLHLEYNENNELVGIWFLDEASKVVPMKKPSTAPATTVKTEKDKPGYSPEQIAAFSSDETVKELLYVAARFVGHPLSMNETTTLLFWYDQLQMDPDLIEHLIVHCVENNHTSFSYMNSIAIAWADEGITTVDQAQNATKVYSDLYRTVSKAFGISGRALIDAELAYIEKWAGMYGFSAELINEACTRTILAINKPDFKYADSILLRWYNSGVKSTADLKPLDEAHKNTSVKKAKETVARPAKSNSFTGIAQRQYDYDALEQQLLKRN